MSELKIEYKNGKIITRKMTESGLLINLIGVLLLVITVIGFFTIDTKDIDLKEAAIETVRYFGIMFGTPKALGTHFGLMDNFSEFDTFIEAVKVLGKTLALAFLTTLIGSVIALVLGLFAAKNLTNAKLSNFLKALVTVIRAVPTVLWVLIFAIGNGLGAVAAVIGMSFHTVGFLLKSYSESFEELDQGSIEALKASGASWLSIVFQAVLPSSITQILSWTFIRFEINFGVAVAMGAAAGAGGIGFNLFMSAGYFFDMREIGYITYLILIVALIMEFIANKLKKEFKINK